MPGTKTGFILTHEDRDFKYYRIDRDMNSDMDSGMSIQLKKMETDEEIRMILRHQEGQR